MKTSRSLLSGGVQVKGSCHYGLAARTRSTVQHFMFCTLPAADIAAAARHICVIRSVSAGALRARRQHGDGDCTSYEGNRLQVISVAVLHVTQRPACESRDSM
jgi:hypothetical protein